MRRITTQFTNAFLFLIILIGMSAERDAHSAAMLTNVIEKSWVVEAPDGGQAAYATNLGIALSPEQTQFYLLIKNKDFLTAIEIMAALTIEQLDLYALIHEVVHSQCSLLICSYALHVKLWQSLFDYCAKQGYLQLCQSLWEVRAGASQTILFEIYLVEREHFIDSLNRAMIHGSMRGDMPMVTWALETIKELDGISYINGEWKLDWRVEYEREIKLYNSEETKKKKYEYHYALNAAAGSKQKEICCLLLQNGCDPKNTEPCRPLADAQHHASQADAGDIANMLGRFKRIKPHIHEWVSLSNSTEPRYIALPKRYHCKPKIGLVAQLWSSAASFFPLAGWGAAPEAPKQQAFKEQASYFILTARALYQYPEVANEFNLDEEGNTILHNAILTKNRRIIRLCLWANHLLLGIRNKRGWTPLEVAFLKGYEASLHAILSFCFDASTRAIEQSTSLDNPN